ncbi:AlpA family phage regulatory protein [Aeromonas dhakensis]|uniref:helix-turn-helix transcriptional regulator n=1 Tax=Aeromonas dhakensis TaxID=196024 RepID=UPI00215873E3|nr:AlpA family phage regulatory protein [Aeromonas dhakensis]MCR6741262.1 AlpA family phage regulatory protein [Aeromonas dhakensis]
MSIKVMRCSDVVNMLGISRSKLYDMLNPKSPRFDATFPKRIRIGANSVGFLEHEVSQWVISRQEV